MASVPATKLPIGRVLSRATALFRKNPWLIIGLSLLLYALPNFLLEASQGFPIAPVAVDPDNIALLLVTLTITIIGSLLLSAALNHVAIRTDAGETPGLLDTLKAAVRLAIPVLIVGFLQTLSFIIGAFFFLVPGLILLLMFSVAVPALVAERLGIIDSMKRSRALTSGARWRIFLLFLIFGLIILALVTPLFATMTLAPNNGMLTAIVTLAISTLASLYPLLFAALFLELREWKEGTPPDQLAEIFA